MSHKKNIIGKTHEETNPSQKYPREIIFEKKVCFKKLMISRKHCWFLAFDLPSLLLKIFCTVGASSGDKNISKHQEICN